MQEATATAAASIAPTVSVSVPSGQSLALVSALSNPENHELHLQAIRARDQALGDAAQYSHWCLQLAYILLGADHPQWLIQHLPAQELEYWKRTDLPSVARLEQDPSLWIPFGQMAGLLLKNALLRPPMIAANNNKRLCVSAEIAAQLRPALLQALQCRHAALRAVASTVIAVAAVSVDGVQPHLHCAAGWPGLVSELIQLVQQQPQSSAVAAEGAMLTLRKIMEDGPEVLSAADLDHLVPVLIHCLHANPTNNTAAATTTQTIQLAALQSLASCLSAGLLPAAWVAHFNEYLQGLSLLATSTSSSNNADIQQWICRNLVTVLDVRTEYLAPHLHTIAPFVLQATARNTSTNNVTSNSSNASSFDDERVALEACDFWLTFASLDDTAVSGDMHEVVGALLPQLIPVLLNNMVYSQEKQMELLLEYEEQQQRQQQQNTKNLRPIFHRSKAAQNRSHNMNASAVGIDHSSSHNDADEDDTGYERDDEDEDDDDDNEWTLRKCAAASLDALANLYGGEIILPILLPVLEQGFAANNQSNAAGDPWKLEACILALGAVAEGCMKEMQPYLGQIHPYLLQLLSAPLPQHQQQQQQQPTLPVVQCIAAWALGQYATWAVEQVQSGEQGHLLAQMTEILIHKLPDPHPQVQVAAVSALGVVAEAAGDLMAPYLEPLFTALIAALHQYQDQSKSRLAVLDVLGALADCCGPAIAEGTLPSIYVPPLLQLWDQLAQRNPAERMLLPLMESLASMAVTAGTNFQPYALDCFDHAMGTIESVTLILTASADSDTDDDEIAMLSEEDVDPIVCATDLLDGLVEGLGGNVVALLSSSTRYSPMFLNVLLALCRHDVGTVRMSALALSGDLARHAPTVLQPALPQLLHEAIISMEYTNTSSSRRRSVTLSSSEATNAVWAVGEICVQCQNGHAAFLEPVAPKLVQCLIGFLMGNGENLDSNGDATFTNPLAFLQSGLRENAAACMGRLAKVNPQFVAPDLSRFLTGWCDGMAKISDTTERRDAFQGFVQTVYANPEAIAQAGSNVAATCISVLFAILSWHIPDTAVANRSLLTSTEYPFAPFPHAEAELGSALVKLVHDMKVSVGEETWHRVQKGLPVNVRRLLRENYQL